MPEEDGKIISIDPGRAKKVVANSEILDEDDTSLDIDVLPAYLLCRSDNYYLGSIYREIEKQWGNGSRIGTVYAYFDHANYFHMHFATRGANCLMQIGALEDVPVGHLPGYFVVPQADVSDSPACKACERLASLPASVDAHDSRWEQIDNLLREMMESDDV